MSYGSVIIYLLMPVVIAHCGILRKISKNILWRHIYIYTCTQIFILLLQKH